MVLHRAECASQAAARTFLNRQVPLAKFITEGGSGAPRYSSELKASDVLLERRLEGKLHILHFVWAICEAAAGGVRWGRQPPINGQDATDGEG